jgi:hypothetical protein
MRGEIVTQIPKGVDARSRVPASGWTMKTGTSVTGRSPIITGVDARSARILKDMAPSDAGVRTGSVGRPVPLRRPHSALTGMFARQSSSAQTSTATDLTPFTDRSAR